MKFYICAYNLIVNRLTKINLTIMENQEQRSFIISEQTLEAALTYILTSKNDQLTVHQTNTLLNNLKNLKPYNEAAKDPAITENDPNVKTK